MQALEFADVLTAASDPDYSGPNLPTEPQEEIVPEFPWWFGYMADRSTTPVPVPPPPPPEPKEGIPEQGPYTVTHQTRP